MGKEATVHYQYGEDSGQAKAVLESNERVLARISTVSDLNHVLDTYQSFASNPTIWVIYPKGVKSFSKPTNAAGETVVRETLRQEGLIDTKIASVSATSTGLRFMKSS